MPLYEYECGSCGHAFEQRHGMNEEPVFRCPICGGEVSRKISGGAGFIVKGGSSGRSGNSAGGCSLETSGRTCCGRDHRCQKPPCEG
ncbi:MAG: zinc ribbon domain-containing protein [Acidobacteria bacterium]|nr:zinc ribbon domain-containing protein [Acidobacteriota bacterium]